MSLNELIWSTDRQRAVLQRAVDGVPIQIVIEALGHDAMGVERWEHRLAFHPNEEKYKALFWLLVSVAERPNVVRFQCGDERSLQLLRSSTARTDLPGTDEEINAVYRMLHRLHMAALKDRGEAHEER